MPPGGGAVIGEKRVPLFGVPRKRPCHRWWRISEGASLVAEQLAFDQLPGIAAMLIATNRTRLSVCRDVESTCHSSLPVPGSPFIMTVIIRCREAAMVRWIACIEGLRPISGSRSSVSRGSRRTEHRRFGRCCQRPSDHRQQLPADRTASAGTRTPHAG